MKPDRAPGFKRRKNKDGSTAFYWIAQNCRSDVGDFPIETVRLHGPEEEMAQRCRVLASELHIWLLGNKPPQKPKFESTVSGLIRLYRHTPESPYRTVKANSRQMYDDSLDLLETEHGDHRLDALTGLDFMRWYQTYRAPREEGGPERIRRAYKAMQLLRIAVKFGVAAGIQQCFRLATTLEALRFAQPEPRTVAPTFKMIESLCTLAIEDGRRSIALAQALQFELTLRQIDVIGEWEKVEKGASGLVLRGERWSGGLLWNHIGPEWILEKRTTKTGQKAVHDIKAYPFLLAMLQSVPKEERVGPVIKDEGSGFPYKRRHYAKVWRALAREAGVPDSIMNRDSRAGGITEGSDSGADIEHLRHHANHSDIKTTGRYNRKTLEKTRAVAHLRVAHRRDEALQVCDR